MGESLFDRHPHVVVSTDFIKSDRRRDEFLRDCPELVIVDEAHTCVAGDGAGQTGPPPALRAAARPRRRPEPPPGPRHRHPALRQRGGASATSSACSTPTSATVDLDQHDRAASCLARHFVQRRRGDIRHYLDEDTPFPSDRLTRDETYSLSPAYRDLFDDVLAYAREQVARRRRRRAAPAGPLVVRPRAAARARLQPRAPPRPPCAPAPPTAEAATVAEADALGRAARPRRSRRRGAGGRWTSPPARSTTGRPTHQPRPAERRRLRELRPARRRARRARAATRKLAAGSPAGRRSCSPTAYDPIVFCRFIDTADYVAEHLADALGPRTSGTVAAVTGEPAARRARAPRRRARRHRRHARPRRHRLPVRGRQPPGRTSTPSSTTTWPGTRPATSSARAASTAIGQRKDVVRAVTLYGEDNGIDGIVLDVLHPQAPAPSARPPASPCPSPATVRRRHRGDRRGPAAARGGLPATSSTLDIEPRRQRPPTSTGRGSRPPRRRRPPAPGSRSTPSSPRRSPARSTDVRAALGCPRRPASSSSRDVADARSAPPSRGTDDGFTAVTAALPLGAAHAACPPGLRDPLPFHADPPADRGARRHRPHRPRRRGARPLRARRAPWTPPSRRTSGPPAAPASCVTDAVAHPHHPAAGPAPLPPHPADPVRHHGSWSPRTPASSPSRAPRTPPPGSPTRKPSACVDARPDGNVPPPVAQQWMSGVLERPRRAPARPGPGRRAPRRAAPRRAPPRPRRRQSRRRAIPPRPDRHRRSCPSTSSASTLLLPTGGTQ